ncbi:hypothetical protein D4764_22G0005720, partial [Takifugu flavidus]
MVPHFIFYWPKIPLITFISSTCRSKSPFFLGNFRSCSSRGLLGFSSRSHLMKPNGEFHSSGQVCAMREDLNDVGYTVYLIKNVQSEEAAVLCMADSHNGGRGDGVTASSEDDQLAGFGARAKSTWKEIWDSGGDGYADFVIGKRCVPGTRMSRLQQNLLKRQQSTTSSTPAEHPMKAPAEPLAMEEDVEMEREMLSIHNSDLQVQSYAMPVAAAALPTPLMLDSIEKIPISITEDRTAKAPALVRHPIHTAAPDPSCSSCGWWVHWRREYPHSWFGHQALPIEPQAWLQGGALVNLRAGVLRGLAPSYLEELVIPYQPNRPLRSQNAGLLVVPRVSRSRMGGRAFSYQAPLLWNQLPVQFQLLS